MQAAFAYSDSLKDPVGGWEGVDEGISNNHCGGGSGGLSLKSWEYGCIVFSTVSAALWLARNRVSYTL